MSQSAREVERRRSAVAAAWNLTDEVVVIAAGQPISIPGRADQTYPFRAHPEYFYLTDCARPGGIIAFDPSDGWTHFLAQPTADELLFSGPAPLSCGLPLSRFGNWAARRRGRPVIALGAAWLDDHTDVAKQDILRSELNRIRRRKDAVEIERIRCAVIATQAGFAAVSALIAAGVSERRLRIELEAEFFRHGADHLTYETIIASGSRSAILHALPSDRILANGETVLVDAGAEVGEYGCDVTRTFVVGRWSTDQRDLRAVIRQTQKAAIDRCVVGTEYREIHLAAMLEIAAGLNALGILTVSPETAVEMGACSLFFPHGIGHLVGLGVRDAGGQLLSRQPRSEPYFRHLRVDLPLEAGHVVTIEPGVYFADHVISDPDVRNRFRNAVDWDRVDAVATIGGMRVEDNVLVTSSHPEVLTLSIPHPLDT